MSKIANIDIVFKCSCKAFIFRGELCAIDWKKSDKTKSTVESTYDAPLQLMSYIGALNADPRYAYKVC